MQFVHPTRRLSVVRGGPQPAAAALERLAKTPCRLLTGPQNKSPQGVAWTGVAFPHVVWSKLQPALAHFSLHWHTPACTGTLQPALAHFSLHWHTTPDSVICPRARQHLLTMDALTVSSH
jgi:hypothetical protein